MKEFYSIGEFGALFKLNVQTLYYYDSIGLLKPQKRDAQTGRRYYAFGQVYQLAAIRYMRRLGYSVEQIKAFFASSDTELSLQNLREQSRVLREQWNDILQIDNVIQRKIFFIEQQMKALDARSVRVRWFPERRYIPIGDEEILYYHDSFYFYPTIAFYRKGVKSFGAYLDVSMGGIDLDALSIRPDETGVIPAGNYLCACHVGPYERIEANAAALRAEYPQLQLKEEMIDFNIIDQFVESDENKYITEMQIPIQD